MIASIWKRLHERTKAAAGTLLRRRNISLGIAVMLLPLIFLASQARGVYYCHVDVLFLAPPAVVAGNVLQADPAQTLSFAAIVEQQINAEYPSSAPRSTSAPLYGMGLRNTHAIFIPNSGGQWQLSYSRPMITVEVVAESPETAATTLNRLAGRISELAADSQTKKGIPPAVQITTDKSLGTPSVMYIPVRSGIAAFALLLLTLGLVVGVPLLAERVAVTARARRSDSGFRPMERFRPLPRGAQPSAPTCLEPGAILADSCSLRSGGEVQNILLMTATITPPPGVPNLTRTDPAQRLQDYLEALDFYLSLLDRGVDAIVLGENSGSDLSALHELAFRRGHAERVEFVSFDGLDHPPIKGRGYGEFKLVDYLMAASKTIQAYGSTATIWKVTGRYIVRNLDKIIAHQPVGHLDLYCNLRDRPSPWADLYLLAWSARGHEKLLAGVYHEFDEESLTSAPEVKFRELVDRARDNASLRVVPRFRVVPYVVGLRGGDGRPYTRGRGTVKYWARAASARFARNLWI